MNGRPIAEELRSQAQGVLGDRTILNVNSTSAGGGVAEMLWVLLSYVVDAGLSARWIVIEGDPAFFELTSASTTTCTGRPATADRSARQSTSRTRPRWRRRRRPSRASCGPATSPSSTIHSRRASPGRPPRRRHRRVRCHVGVDVQNEHSERGWEFLRPYVEPHVDHYVFHGGEFAPDWVPQDRLTAIPPSIDPFAPKNQDLAPEIVEAIITRRPRRRSSGRHHFHSQRRIHGHGGSSVRDRAPRAPPGPDVPLVTQISRWDPMKDMVGVLRGFVDRTWTPRREPISCSPVPQPARWPTDPEAGRVLKDCVRLWESLPPEDQRRVSLASLPMDDPEENAAMVNALQRHSAVVVQKRPRRGLRPHGRGGAAEGPAGGGQRGRRHPGSDHRRPNRPAAPRSAGPTGVR